MTMEDGDKYRGFVLTAENYRKVDELAEALYGDMAKTAKSVVINRLLRVAEVRDGKLVADERQEATR
jgi:hypothetical protein